MAENGLLEQVILRVQTEGSSHRLYGGEGQVVGYSRLFGGQCLWLPGWKLSVHEKEQSPLVFTIRRCLTLRSRYEVRDAEEDLVGTIVQKMILDRWEQEYYTIETDRILTMLGEPIACWTRDGTAILVEMNLRVQHDPFKKMLALAAILLL